jgi:hypothetical protein
VGASLSGVGSLIDEIETQTAPSERHAATLRRITNLFLEGANDFSEGQIGVLNDVLCQLAS